MFTISISLCLISLHVSAFALVSKQRYQKDARSQLDMLFLSAADDDDNASVERKTNAKKVMLISDSTGVTAKTALSKCLSQFEWDDDQCFVTEDGEYCEIRRKLFTFVRSEEAVAAILKKAKKQKAMVAFTFADPNLRMKTVRMCELSNLPSVDLMGPMLDCLSNFLEQSPVGAPRTKVSLNSNYYSRIEAVEFTLKADDGRAPWLAQEADVVIVGVSRTGKTPLSVVLSQLMGWKVCNIPLVLEVPPPDVLMDVEKIDPKRVFCLIIHPKELGRIRRARLESRGVTTIESGRVGTGRGGGSADAVPITKSNYADRNYLLKDLMKARELCRSQGWTEIDVTDTAVEETASYISELISERFDD